MTAQDLLGLRFEVVGHEPQTFVTVVRVNEIKQKVGLWWECPARQEKISSHIDIGTFRKMDLARV